MKKFILSFFILLWISCYKNSNNHIIDSISNENHKNKIVVTKEYIKTGWMLRGTSNTRLAIQEIFLINANLKIDSLKFEDFLNQEFYRTDSCMVLFGKDNASKIYFNQVNNGWTWDKICDLENEKIVESKHSFQFKNNQFYRILNDYWFNGLHSYKIYLYVDLNGNMKVFMKNRDGKSI